MPSDAIDHSDAALLRRCATADGTLLHPGAPAVLIDAAVLALAQAARPAAPAPRLSLASATLHACYRDTPLHSATSLPVMRSSRGPNPAHPRLRPHVSAPRVQGKPMGEVWLAPTSVDGRRFGSLFAARLPRDLELRALDLGLSLIHI